MESKRQSLCANGWYELCFSWYVPVKLEVAAWMTNAFKREEVINFSTSAATRVWNRRLLIWNGCSGRKQCQTTPQSGLKKLWSSCDAAISADQWRWERLHRKRNGNFLLQVLEFRMAHGRAAAELHDAAAEIGCLLGRAIPLNQLAPKIYMCLIIFNCNASGWVKGTGLSFPVAQVTPVLHYKRAPAVLNTSLIAGPKAFQNHLSVQHQSAFQARMLL